MPQRGVGTAMRELVMTENITVDGVIDASGGWFQPGDSGDIDVTDLVDVIGEQMRAADAFLVGRVTFEEMRGYWPLQTDDQTGVSDYLNQVAKYVVSSTMNEPGWPNSTVLSGEMAAEVRALKERPGGDIVTTGSMQLAHSLIGAGLVDEYRLFVYPVVLGTGARLFEAADLGALSLVEARPFGSGVVLLTYRPTTPAN